MGCHRKDIWFIFSSVLLFVAPCKGQKLSAIESNGVFFSGLPRPPSEINAILQKGEFFGNTLGPGIAGKFTTISPGKSGSTPHDFKFNSAKPDNRFAVTGGRTQQILVTRPTFFTGNPQTQTTPRFVGPSTPRPTTPRLQVPSNLTRPPAQPFARSKEATLQGSGRAEFTTRPPAPVFIPNATPPPQRSPNAEFTTRQPAPVFIPNTTPPSQRQASILNTGTTTKTTTLRPTTRLVPLSVFNPGTASSTTTTPRPTTRLATLRFITHFSTLRPATRTPTQETGSEGVTSTGTGLNFAFCDRGRCDKVCRERFGQNLNSSSCLKNACKCEVLETCRASVCLEMCRKTNPVQDVLSADCLGNNCRCALNRVCEPDECRQRCLLAHGNKLISADCARRNACQCVHS